MDILTIYNWLVAIAVICGLMAFALVVIEIGNWIADWFESWWNKKQYRKINQAYPYNWNKQDWKEW